VLTALLARTGEFTLNPDDAPRWVEGLLLRRHEYLPLTFTRSLIHPGLTTQFFRR